MHGASGFGEPIVRDTGACVTIAIEKSVAGRGPDTASGPLGAALSKARDVLSASDDRARLQRDALIAFSVRGLSAGILYLSQIVLARWMGGTEYGIYVFVWTWVLVLGGLANLGLPTAMIRLVPEYHETGRLGLLRGLLRWGRLTACAFSTAVALAALALLAAFAPLIAQPYVWPLFLAVACLPMVTLSDVQDGIGRGGGWMAVALLPPYVLRPAIVLVGMTVAHGLGWPMSAQTAVGAAVVATWAATIIQCALVHVRVRREIPPGARERRPDLWLGTSLPLLAITGAELLIQNSDLLVVGRYLPPEQGAIYFAAAKTMSLVLFVHYAVGSAMAKRFSSLNARGDKGALRAFARDAVHWTFWPSLVGAVLIVLLGKPLLWLFGPRFVDGYPVMLVLVLGFLGRAAMGPSEFLLNMLGEQKACAAVILSMAVLNIGLLLAWVPAFGIVGAAMSTATVLVLGALLNTTIARRRLGIDIAIWRNLGRPAASGA